VSIPHVQEFITVTARLMLLTLAVFALAYAPAMAEPDSADEVPLLTELEHARQAWLHKDRKEATARIAGLGDDPRVSDLLQGWYTGMHTWLLLEQGKVEEASAELKRHALASSDARATIKAARILLTFGHTEPALRIVRAVREEQPYSFALQRAEAGLLWLGGMTDEAIDAYAAIVAADTRDGYPYIQIDRTVWGSYEDWPSKKTATQEPFSSLFNSPSWYSTDLPGADRLVLELAADPGAVAVHEARMEGLLNEAEQASRHSRSVRTADEDVRQSAAKAERAAMFRAAFSVQVVAQALIANKEFEQAAILTGRGLQLVLEHVALLDLQAQCFGALGRAEELRTGPLTRLRARAGLEVRIGAASTQGSARLAMDRIFEGARVLFGVNPEAGRKQFDALVTMFSGGSGSTEAELGVWLYRNGMPDLARHFLVHASMALGIDRSTPMHGAMAVPELILAKLGTRGIIADFEPDDPDMPPPPPNQRMLPDNVHPLVLKAERGGRLAATLKDPRSYLSDVSGVDVWGFQASGHHLFVSCMLQDYVRELCREVLFELPATLAKDVPEEEIEQLLDLNSDYSRSVSNGLTAFGESLRDFRSTRNWRTRQQITNQTHPTLGMLETRVTLLRAWLLQRRPSDLESLSELLEPQLRIINLRLSSGHELSGARRVADEQRRAAGVPYIPHLGLLLTCAAILAEGGHGQAAAELIWHNRNIEGGVHSGEGVQMFGAAVAEDPLLASMLRMEAQRSPRLSTALQMLEFSTVSALVQEHGSKADLNKYIEGCFMSWLSTREEVWLAAQYPGFADLPDKLVVQTPPRATAAEILDTSARNASARVVVARWFRLRGASDGGHAAFRMAAWAMLSDLGVDEDEPFLGHARAVDASVIWHLLRDAAEQFPDQAQDSGLNAAHLQSLIDRTTGTFDRLHILKR
jgi:hypothetical protein